MTDFNLLLDNDNFDGIVVILDNHLIIQDANKIF
jgi:hypothetical protein